MIVRQGWHCVAMVLGLTVLIAGCGPRAIEPPSPPDIFAPAAVAEAMARAFDWQIVHIVYEAPLPDGGTQPVSDTEWVRGAFFAGVMAASSATGDSRYLAAAMEISRRNGWQPGPRPRHADDLCIAQTYAQLYLVERDPVMIEATVARLEAMIADPRPGPVAGWSEDDNWSW